MGRVRAFLASLWELVKLLAEGDANFRAARMTGRYPKTPDEVIDLRSPPPER